MPMSMTPLKTDSVVIPYANTKTEVNMAMTTSFVSPNCLAICSEAGAIIDDDTGDMKVKADTIAVAAHFFLNDQMDKKLL